MFASRAAAGRALVPLVRSERDRSLRILALSREGISIAAQVAMAFGADLELLCSRHSAIAVALEGCRPEVDLNRVIELGLHASEVTDLLASLSGELDQAIALYRGHRPFPCLHDRHVVLVDDGVMPTHVLIAAIRRIRQLAAARITVALPACSPATLRLLCEATDDVVCIETTDRRDIESFYEDAEPVGDMEALALLTRSRLAASRVRNGWNAPCNAPMHVNAR